MKSYVYILPLEDSSIFKIGKSNEVDIRMNTLRKTWGKFDMEKSFVLESDTKSVFRLEKTLHYMFAEYNEKENIPKQDGSTEFFNMKCFDSLSIFINHMIDIKVGLKKIDISKFEKQVPTSSRKMRFNSEHESMFYHYVLERLEFATAEEDNLDIKCLKLDFKDLQEHIGLGFEDFKRFLKGFKLYFSSALCKVLHFHRSISISEDFSEISFEFSEWEHYLISNTSSEVNRKESYISSLQNVYIIKLPTLIQTNIMYSNYFKFISYIMRYYDSSKDSCVEIKFKTEKIKAEFNFESKVDIIKFIEEFIIYVRYVHGVIRSVSITEEIFSLEVNFKAIKEMIDNYDSLENEIDKFLVDKIKSYIPSPLSE